MATVDGTHPHETIDTMALLAATRPHPVIQMSRDPQGHLRDTPKTQVCVTTLQDDLRPQEGVVIQGLQDTTPLTILVIHRGIIMASGLPDKGTRTGLHAANPKGQSTCRANQAPPGPAAALPGVKAPPAGHQDRDGRAVRVLR